MFEKIQQLQEKVIKHLAAGGEYLALTSLFYLVTELVETVRANCVAVRELASAIDERRTVEGDLWQRIGATDEASREHERDIGELMRRLKSFEDTGLLSFKSMGQRIDDSNRQFADDRHGIEERLDRLEHLGAQEADARGRATREHERAIGDLERRLGNLEDDVRRLA